MIISVCAVKFIYLRRKIKIYVPLMAPALGMCVQHKNVCIILFNNLYICLKFMLKFLFLSKFLFEAFLAMHCVYVIFVLKSAHSHKYMYMVYINVYIWYTQLITHVLTLQWLYTKCWIKKKIYKKNLAFA